MDFFIVGKTSAFYEKFLFSEEKTFAIFRFTIFKGRNFRENGQKSWKSRKFLLAKVSVPKVVIIRFPWRIQERYLRWILFLIQLLKIGRFQDKCWISRKLFKNSSVVKNCSNSTVKTLEPHPWLYYWLWTCIDVLSRQLHVQS